MLFREALPSEQSETIAFKANYQGRFLLVKRGVFLRMLHCQVG